MSETRPVARSPGRRFAATVRDIGFVSFGKYGQYLVTVVTVPLLARLLGAEGLGLLAIGMSSYFIGSVLVDLNIAQFLSARMRHEDVNQLRGNYLTVRAGLLAAIAAALLTGLALGVAGAPLMILLGLFTGGFWAMSEDWVLIGQARFGTSMSYQALSRAVYLVLLLVLLPHHPNAAVALLCLGASSAVTVGLTWWDALRRYGRPARPRQLRSMVRLGAPMLASRLLVVSYGQGSATIYSSVLDAASLGLFSAGDRLVRAVQSLLDAIGFALLPRMAAIGEESRFWQRARHGLLACVGVAGAATVTLALGAPLLIHLIFGDEFAGAVPLLQLEALILVPATVSSFITTAVLPVRQDTRGVLVGAVTGTVMSVGWLVVAASTHSVWTLVAGTVCSEAVVALWYLLRMRRLRMRGRSRRIPVLLDIGSIQGRTTL